MAATAGRDFRIEYSSDGGTTWSAIAGARTDSLSIANEAIVITDKDDNGIQHLLDDIGSKVVTMTCEGVMKDNTLSELALNSGSGSSIHDLRFVFGAITTMTGQWFITNFDPTGADGTDPGTFTCGFTSHDTVTSA